MAFRTNKTPVLQEKSASGSVASFNTALAMPLVNGEFSIEAYQEGSGDPSPVHVRAIHGFSEVNVTRCGVNLWDEQWELGSLDYNGNPIPSTTAIRSKNFIKVNPSTKYYIAFSTGKIYIACYDEYKKFIGYIPSTSGIETPSEVFTYPNCKYIRLNFGSAYGTTYRNDTSVNSPSTDTDYHAYTGNTYTIQLGQDVYGGVLDLDSGVLTITHIYYQTTGEETITQYDYLNQHGVSFGGVLSTSQNKPVYISNMSEYKGTTILSSGAVWCGVNNRNIYWIGILDILNMTLEQFETWIVDNPLQVAYLLPTPIEIQLTPEQITTIIGDNNIFADTGDIDLTYKDLDIAKRGNFREVFKLPS